MPSMDRSQHKRYLLYLERYVYFGRGQERLDAETFAVLDAELSELNLRGGLDDAAKTRRRTIAKQLLRD